MGKLRVKKSAGEIRRESKDLKRLIAYAGGRLGLQGQFTAQDFVMAIDQAATIIAQARAQQQQVTVDTAALDAEISKVAESATAGGAKRGVCRVQMLKAADELERLERELAAAQAENAELKHANAALAKHRDQLTRTCADWEKAMSALAAMVMRYFKSINYRRTGKGDVADALYDKCVKRGDDDRALVAENSRLREERDTLKELQFILAAECKTRRNAWIALTASVNELLAAAHDAGGAVGVRYWNAVFAVREALATQRDGKGGAA